MAFLRAARWLYPLLLIATACAPNTRSVPPPVAPPGGGFGVILRDSGPGPRDGLSQSGRYLVVEVGDEGTYGIWERQQDHWDEVVPWTPAAAIKPGTNELTVRAIGPHVQVSINGSTITSVDVDLTQGSLGLFAGGDGNEIAVEAFHLQAIMWEDFYGPGGKPTADTDLEQQLNEIVRLINTDAGGLIRDIQSAYQDVCAYRPN
jgi:hypothetical protein